MKNILLKVANFFLVISSISNAQDITNALGTNGLFTIKNGSNNYLTLSQATGYLSLDKSFVLPNTINSTIGVIYKNANRFIHDYVPVGADGWNTFVGINAGNFTMTAPFSYNSSYNSAFGYQSLSSNTTGYFNTAMGFNSLYLNSTGYWNTAVGSSSLATNSSGYENTALGLGTLYLNTSGYDNTAIGVQSLRENTTGSQNTATGFRSLYSNTSGTYNTAVGWYSLYSNTVMSQNTAVGYHSLSSNNQGSGNTAVGSYALRFNSSGSYNTCVGSSAGFSITTGSSLTCLGNNSEPSSPTATNQITLGDNLITSLRCNVTTITSLSDARDKKNIRDLDLGIDFLMKIQPRLFNWDKREWYENNISDGSKIQETPTAGFIAQELDSVQIKENAEWLNLVLKDNPEKLEATPGNLFPVVVKAIQELKTEKDGEIAELKIKNEQLASALDNLENKKNEEIAELKNRLANYEEFQSMIVKELNQIKSTRQNLNVQLVNAEGSKH